MSLSIGKFLPAQRRSLIAGLFILPGVVFVLGMLAVKIMIADPKVALLFPEQGAEWIRFPEPIREGIRNPQTLVSTFRTHFEVTEVSEKAILSLRAMRRATVLLDNQVVFKSEAPLNEWKKVHHIDLSPILSLGPHELRVEVQNRNAYPILLAYCKPLRLFTGQHWEGSTDGKTWTQVLSVHKPQHFPLSRKFQRADQAFFSKLPVFIPLFLVVFAFTLLLGSQNRPSWLNRTIPTAKALRWMLMVAWVVMAINNTGKVPFYVGMDLDAHIDYIRYLSQYMSIPLATDGWQMFEPPLFYLISVIIYDFSRALFSTETVFQMLRILPLLCGMAQIELCYRALRYVYPKREDLQALGTVVGGLLPMNIYISQVVGCEPLAGCLTGLVVVLALRFMSASSLGTSGQFLLMGLFLGLTLLTKMTAMVLIPPLVFFIGYKIFANRHSAGRPMILIAQRIALVVGIAFVVSGWFYIRNYIELGKFFIGGWDPVTGFVWWQDPAYRIIQHFTSFGEALYYPVNSAIRGIWDSLYSTLWMDAALSGRLFDERPPWNYGFLFSNVWLSLLPCAAILLGVFKALRKPTRPLQHALLFSAACVIFYVLAILHYYLTVPIYAAGKATFALGLSPCIAILWACGFEILTRKPILKGTLCGIMACWVVSVYSGFFVFENPADAKNRCYLGDVAASYGNTAEAIEYYREALSIDPEYDRALNNLGNVFDAQHKYRKAIAYYTKALRTNPEFEEARVNLGNALIALGEIDEAIGHYTEGLRLNPRNVDAHINLGNTLAKQGNLEEAVHHFSEAIRIRPKVAEAHYNLALTLMKKGSVQDAINHYSKAIDLKPDYAKAYYNLGNIMEKQGDLDGAISHYSEALIIQPGFVGAHNRLGNALVRQGKIRAAIGHYRKALRINPVFADGHHNLANALVKRGNLDGAISHYSKALKIKPDFPEAQRGLEHTLQLKEKSAVAPSNDAKP